MIWVSCKDEGMREEAGWQVMSPSWPLSMGSRYLWTMCYCLERSIGSGYQSIVFVPTASASLGNLLGMQISGSHPSPLPGVSESYANYSRFFYFAKELWTQTLVPGSLSYVCMTLEKLCDLSVSFNFFICNMREII